jgi:hypothetical protein
MLILADDQGVQLPSGPPCLTSTAARSSQGGLGALHWNGAAVSFIDGRLVVKGYPIPREALDASLHTRRLCEIGGVVPQAPQNAGIGRDVLPQNVGCHVLSQLL